MTATHPADPRIDAYIDALPETINARALGERFKQIIANNRAGDWRRLERKG